MNVTDIESGVDEVVLSYTTDNGTTWENVTMDEHLRYTSRTALYQGTIQSQTYGTWVKFRVIAFDNAGNPAVKDNAGEYYFLSSESGISSSVIIADVDDLVGNNDSAGQKALREQKIAV